MKKTLVGLLLAAIALAPTAALAAKGAAQGKERKNPFASIPVTGTSSAGAFAGTLDVVGWTTAADGGVAAIGILNGTLGGVPAAENMVVMLPLTGGGSGAFATSAVSIQQTACDILNLVLGPLDLNLLGLEVHLNQVVLDLVAQPGPGNLLGNLLCGVAGLLDAVAIGPILANLLNNLTTLLGSLGL